MARLKPGTGRATLDPGAAIQFVMARPQAAFQASQASAFP